mgnify:CR=1 FL=1
MKQNVLAGEVELVYINPNYYDMMVNGLPDSEEPKYKKACDIAIKAIKFARDHEFDAYK